MKVPLDVRFRHLEPSAALEAQVRERAAALERYSRRIVSMHVTLEHAGASASKTPGRHIHHRRGGGSHFHISIRLCLPGKELLFWRNPQSHRNFEDAYAAVNEAFNVIRRQLQDEERLVRQDVKRPATGPHGKVSRVLDGFGFLTTEDGRELYFHEKSVLKGQFHQLAIGDEVRFAEHEGEGVEGPQASSVVRVARQRHHVFSIVAPDVGSQEDAHR